jgi:[acyl-carrier-protein] S-malonyltransferase
MGLKTAFLFPGQGSQVVGMGRDLAEKFAFSKEIFEQADEICKRSISKICFEGPMEELTATNNLQPAITAVSISCLMAINNAGIEADLSAGHSVGEYPALVSAGIVSIYDALKMASKRGELMHREALANPGGMVAVLGMDMAGVMEVVDKAAEKGIISVANHNTAQQIVITGEREPLDYATKLVKGKKARRFPLR